MGWSVINSQATPFSPQQVDQHTRNENMEYVIVITNASSHIMWICIVTHEEQRADVAAVVRRLRKFCRNDSFTYGLMLVQSGKRW